MQLPHQPGHVQVTGHATLVHAARAELQVRVSVCLCILCVLLICLAEVTSALVGELSLTLINSMEKAVNQLGFRLTEPVFA